MTKLQLSGLLRCWTILDEYFKRNERSRIEYLNFICLLYANYSINWKMFIATAEMYEMTV